MATVNEYKSSLPTVGHAPIGTAWMQFASQSLHILLVGRGQKQPTDIIREAR